MSCKIYTSALAVVAALFLSASARASLTINLAFADGSTTYQLTPADAGNTIPIDVWATVTTSIPISATNHDGISYFYYDVLSSLPAGPNTAVDGNISSVSMMGPFNVLGSQAGALMDANGDSVTDLGPDTVNNQLNTTQQMLQLAKPHTGPGGIWDTSAGTNPDVVISPDDLSVSFLLEQLNFQVNSDAGQETVFTPLVPTLPIPYTLANWFQDDPTTQTPGGQYTTTSPIYAGTSVALLGSPAEPTAPTGIALPEPTTVSLLAIGSLGLLARRRKS